MKVYCSHSQKVNTKTSNYNQCKLCLFGWYDNDPVPMVVVGYTEPVEVDERYTSRFDEKSLAKKIFVRCEICKDLKGKRIHMLCFIKRKWKVLLTQNENGRRPRLVILGLVMILISFVGIITMGWVAFHK